MDCVWCPYHVLYSTASGGGMGMQRQWSILTERINLSLSVCLSVVSIIFLMLSFFSSFFPLLLFFPSFLPFGSFSEFCTLSLASHSCTKHFAEPIGSLRCSVSFSFSCPPWSQFPSAAYRPVALSAKITGDKVEQQTGKKRESASDP